jgi:hypothetical protein
MAHDSDYFIQLFAAFRDKFLRVVETNTSLDIAEYLFGLGVYSGHYESMNPAILKKTVLILQMPTEIDLQLDALNRYRIAILPSGLRGDLIKKC